MIEGNNANQGYLLFFNALEESYRADIKTFLDRQSFNFFARIVDRVSTNIGNDGYNRRLRILDEMKKQTTLYHCLLKFRQMNIDRSTKTYEQFVVHFLLTLAFLAKKSLQSILSVYSVLSIRNHHEILSHHGFNFRTTPLSHLYNSLTERFWNRILMIHNVCRDNENAFLEEAQKFMIYPCSQALENIPSPHQIFTQTFTR